MTDAAGIPLQNSQYNAAAARAADSVASADQTAVGDGNDLVASDDLLVCARCERVLAAGVPIRRRATGGWQHENC